MIDGAWTMWGKKGEPGRVQTVTTALDLPQWAAESGPPLRVAVAGDFHLRPRGGRQARMYMGKIMESRPDMIFLLGDYANGHTRKSSMSPEKARDYFRMLRAPLGIFAVQGNHDQYYGWESWKNMFADLGICAMWNDSFLLHLPGGRKLQLSSVRDDYHMRIRPEELPLRLSPSIPHILLSHVPDIFPLLKPGTADAVISAHTHGGQICLPGGIPLGCISREKVKFTYPWSRLNGTPFLITRGLGCSVLPLRPPTLTACEKHPSLLLFTLYLHLVDNSRYGRLPGIVLRTRCRVGCRGLLVRRNPLRRQALLRHQKRRKLEKRQKKRGLRPLDSRQRL